MNFIYQRYDHLPRLSWCAVVQKGSEDVAVYCGPWVETLGDSFVEGVWDDDFEKMNFADSPYFFGSGCTTGKSEVFFSTTCTTLERIHVVRLDDKLYASNSLAFVLEMSGSDLDMDYLDYQKDFTSIITGGINEYKSEIPLKDGRLLELFYFCNFAVDADLNVRKEKKSVPEDFAGYGDYYGRISGALKRIDTNANSDERKVKYGSVTTISRGYDSSACAVLGREIGCETAVTFSEPADKYADDDGTDIARILGYDKVVKGNADSYLTRSDFVESEFLSSGDLGSEIVFCAFEEEYRGNLVLTGGFGDMLWERGRDGVNTEIKARGRTFNVMSLYENRFRVGFINVAVPSYGVLNWPSIHKLSNSSEMEPWSIGEDYDRPIPRRMLEERGVPRDAFGVKKIGAGFNYQYDTMGRLKKRMSPASFESFASFYEENRSLKRLALNWGHVARFFRGVAPEYLNYIFRKLNLKIEIATDAERAESNPFAPLYLFHWGVEMTRERYRID